MFDVAANFHPFECDGYGMCPHCDRAHSDDHDPATCALCDPDYDSRPNAFWDERVALEARRV